jgi:hypothetical protein
VKKLFYTSIICIIILIVPSCRTTYITSSWKANRVFPVKQDKILVLGLIRDADRNLQQKMEDHMAGDLRDKGYNAVTSLSEFGPKAFENLTEKEAIARLKFLDIDAVVTIVLLDKKQESIYIQNGPPQHVNFWNYYGRMYQRIYSKGYWVTDTKFYWESNFYELERGDLLYSVQTQSFSPGNTNALAHEYGQLIIKDMVQNKEIGKEKVGTKGF